MMGYALVCSIVGMRLVGETTVHQDLVCHRNCVPERVGAGKKGVYRKWYFHKIPRGADKSLARPGRKQGKARRRRKFTPF